ncbi:transglycosylase domain-containing protein [Paludifilum halophilum]|uniref:Uncharacterized protein n=1 Tax=Paludifilum halophilum TaxID=1642702 RepID=A0A235B5C6_9BACL|nr:transglycosylase domain-containing protein [Paludifilum halophilum]OYD07508.1 hypothetical protein CHM34_11480 [Paludifilum halophilum]
MDERHNGGEPSPDSERVGSRLEERGRRGKRRRKFFNKKWLLLVVTTTLLLAVAGCSAVMISAKSMPLEKLEEIQFASTIYDVNGNLVTKLGSTNREYVKMNRIKSRELIEKTFIAVEDKRFYEHNGVDYRGIARSVYHNILEGRRAEGASTITMQVARNVVLENRTKTYTRKLQEVAVAWNLERKYGKKEILEAYLNIIYFGNDVQGIQMASKIYFDKDLTEEELEPQEAALLASLPKAPSTYNPYHNPEEAKQRRNLVLGLMAEQGVITEAEKEKYQKTDLGVDRQYLTKHLKDDDYQAYKHYVMMEASQRFGIPEEELATGGYKIRTHLLPRAQKAMVKAFHDDALFENNEHLDGGATVVNPKTGGIAAIAGGREYQGTGYILRSAEEMKQPGSSIKPVTVFAPAVEEKNYTEYTQVPDPPDFRIKSWKPENFQNRSFGELPMKEVVAKSLNVATAWLLKNEVGLDTAVRYAEQAGLDLHAKDRSSYAALALGGLTRGVNTVDMAQAYTPFIHNGKMRKAHAIESISISDQEWESEGDYAEERQVFSPKTAYYMTRMLHYNVEQGTGTSAQLPDGRDVAGKTGTTQESKTAWFVGYTNEYVMSAMVYNESEGRVELSGGAYPAKIFRRVMAEVVKGTPVSRFQNPGVKPPEPPFQLKPVNLKGSYESGDQAIQLSWNDYSDRVRYQVERSEDGSDWEAIAETSNGTYQDRNIVVPPPQTGDEQLDEIFGGARQYAYRVVAIDTETDQRADPSNVVTVRIHPPEEGSPPEEGDEEGDPGGGEQEGDQTGEEEGDPGDDQGDLPGDDQGDSPGDQDGGDEEGNEEGDQGENPEAPGDQGEGTPIIPPPSDEE